MLILSNKVLNLLTWIQDVELEITLVVGT
jgi:hypothetical protein